MINLNQGLSDILSDPSLIIRIFFLLLNMVHGKFELVDYSFVKDLVDETVGLRQVVLEVGRIGDLPGKEIGSG